MAKTWTKRHRLIARWGHRTDNTHPANWRDCFSAIGLLQATRCGRYLGCLRIRPEGLYRVRKARALHDTANSVAPRETAYMKQLSPSPEAAALILGLPLSDIREKLARRPPQLTGSRLLIPPKLQRRGGSKGGRKQVAIGKAHISQQTKRP